LTVHGDVDVSGILYSGILTMDGSNVTVRGNFRDLQILGQVRAIGTVTAFNLAVLCPFVHETCSTPGDLDLNGNTVNVGADFSAGSGTLTMTHPTDILNVAGNVSFANVNETGKLTDGIIYVGANFVNQCYNSTEFVPTGTQVVMNGPSPQTIDLSCSGGPEGNRMFDLTIASGANVTTDNALFIANMLTVNGTFNTGTDAVVDVAGPSPSLVINEGGVVNNHGTIKANLPITNNGQVNFNPVISRNPDGLARTWIGGDPTGPTNWANPGNWGPTGVPTEADAAYIMASAPNQPVLTGNVRVGSLYIEAGASVALGGWNLLVHGDIDNAGTITQAGGVFIDRPAAVQGTMSSASLFISAPVQAIGAIFAGNLSIQGGGDFAVNGKYVTVLQNLSAQGGTITMTNPSDQLEIRGSAGFGNMDETGKLTSGHIYLKGNLLLSCYNNTEFVSTGTQLNMIGTTAQTIAMTCSSSTGNRLYNLLIANGSSVTTPDNPLFIANSLNIMGTFTTSTAAVVDVAGPAHSVVINAGAVLNNNGTLKANLPINNFGTLNGNAVIQR